MEVNATDRCGNCGQEFAEHNYVKDSITDYECPVPHVEMGYGYFCGGDPRKFFPDAESCSPEELANHKAACEMAEKLEKERDLPCPSGWIQVPGGCAHILIAPFGIGAYQAEFQQFFEAAEHDDEHTED